VLTTVVATLEVSSFDTHSCKVILHDKFALSLTQAEAGCAAEKQIELTEI
jgi:hypothetical protein